MRRSRSERVSRGSLISARITGAPPAGGLAFQYRAEGLIGDDFAIEGLLERVLGVPGGLGGGEIADRAGDCRDLDAVDVRDVLAGEGLDAVAPYPGARCLVPPRDGHVYIAGDLWQEPEQAGG